MDNENLLTEGAERLGITLGAAQAERFAVFGALLRSWNEKMNLTAITDERDIIIKHFLDSLTVLAAADIAPGASVIDVGTGAGFPGIPMKIARSDIELTLADALAKRIGFLNEVIAQTGLSGARAVHMRAEEAGRSPAFRERYDFAVSRAVAALPVLCEYCLPFVKPGGIFLAMKGGDVRETGELEAARAAIAALGSSVVDVKQFILPYSGIEHTIIVIKKLRRLSPKYPRTQAQISKTPIK